MSTVAIDSVIASFAPFWLDHVFRDEREERDELENDNAKSSGNAGVDNGHFLHWKDN